MTEFIAPAEQPKRTQFSRTMRRARQQLISTSGSRPAFDLDMIHNYALNRMRAGLVLPILTLVVAGVSWWFEHNGWIIVWFFANISMQLAILYACYHFLEKQVDFQNLKKWVTTFIIAEITHGVIWAMLFLGVVNNSNIMSVLLAFVSELMLVAILAMFCSSIRRAVLWSTFLPTLTLFYVLLSSNIIVNQFIGALVLLIEFYFLLLSRQLYESTCNALLARAEKDELIHELEQAKGNSDEARRRAEESSLAKSRFLATMSHELRTPLNAIIGFSEMMRNEIFGKIENEHYKGYVKDIHNSGNHLLNVINEILDLSRIEAGRFDLHEEAVFLDEIVGECMNLLKLRATNKSIDLIAQFHADLPPLWADERSVRQIALNLLTNAIKFTPVGGKVIVKIGWTSRGGQYVSIKDTGYGIPEDEIAVVLSNFGRGSMAHKSAEEGTGLGLPIVQGLVELHGGQFTLKSKLREGTEVIVTLPETRVLEPMPQLREKKAQVRK